MVHICVQFFIGVKNKRECHEFKTEKYERNNMKIGLIYLRKTFLIDLLSTVPTLVTYNRNINL